MDTKTKEFLTSLGFREEYEANNKKMQASNEEATEDLTAQDDLPF